MKTSLFALAMILCSLSMQAQHFNLYNTRTLYDVFEHPSQSAYQIDTSRRIAFNILPMLSFNAGINGDAQPALNSLIFDGVYDGRGIDLGKNQYSRLSLNSNFYLVMLRVLHKIKNSPEIGLSWQIRNDARVKVTNETLAVLDDYRLFEGEEFEDAFNSKGHNQSYHQFGLSYRRNLNKRTAVGFKGSLLSGITNNQIKITRSSLTIDEDENSITVDLRGTMRSSFYPDNFESSALKPNFRNPGISLSGGISYKGKDGWFFMGTLKDIGFIKWSKQSYLYNFNAGNIFIENASDNTADDRLLDSIDNRFSRSRTQQGFIAATNGKAEVLINRDYGNYQPNLILSKNVFYEGGEIVLANHYRYRNLVFSLSAGYNTMKFATLGGQFMVKSPNTEFFIGSDHLFRTVSMINELSTEATRSAGPIAASFYLGFGFKFGRVLEHPANANYIPGFEQKSEGGFLKRIFRKRSN